MTTTRYRLLFLILLLILGACAPNAGSNQTPGGADTSLPSTPTPPNTQPAPTLSKSREVTPNPEGTVTAEVGTPFTLEVGQTAAIDSEQLTVTLNAVTEDSRCPASVQCIQAGWVTVSISVLKDGESFGDYELTLGAVLEDQSGEVSIGGVTITLLEVNPYPQEPGGIEQGDYLAVLVVG